MPRFEKPPRRGRGNSDDDSGKDLIVVPDSWTEPRCHVCQSKYREAIDRMIAFGTGYTEISRVFGGEIDRQSISRHAERHLNYEAGAVKRIIDEEAKRADAAVEEGIQGAIKRRVFLEVGLQRALERIVTGDLSVEAKDALMMIDMLDKLDSKTSGVQMDEMRLQFNAFLQAIREICPQEQWEKILQRTRELVEVKQIAAPQE